MVQSERGYKLCARARACKKLRATFFLSIAETIDQRHRPSSPPLLYEYDSRDKRIPSYVRLTCVLFFFSREREREREEEEEEERGIDLVEARFFTWKRR